jgi:hypothetical protein
MKASGIALFVSTLARPCHAFSVTQSSSSGSGSGSSTKSHQSTQLFIQRRHIIDTFAQAAILGTAAATAQALDMDSFVNSQLEKDTTECNPKLDPKCIPKLTPDEALCKYGVAGSDARLASCKRVRDVGGLLPTSKPGERNTAGWVNNPIPL